MKFTILGAGALGSILGAHLSRAGHDVTMIARGARAERIRERGLEVKGLADFTARCNVATEPAQLQPMEVLILAVKTYATESALAPLAGKSVGTVFSLQNGVAKDEHLARAFGAEKVLGAMADFSGELLASGEAAFTRNVNLFLGEPGGGDSARAREIAGAIESSGVPTKAVANIETIEWSKFVGWTGLMAMAVLSRLETGEFLVDPGTALVFARLVRETGELANALGIPIIDNSPVPVATICGLPEAGAVRAVQELGRDFLAKAPHHRMSSLQDLENGRRLEVEETLGFALRKAKERNLDLRALETCYSIVSGLDRAAAVREGSCGPTNSS
jgi:2-dehydropantoate 2-reductase